MDIQQRRQQLKNYFSKFDLKIPIILIIAGLLLTFSGIRGLGTLGVLLLIAGAIPLTIQIMRRKNAPTDEMVDQWLKEDMAELCKKSYEKLGIEEEENMLHQDPLIVIAPLFWQTHGIDSKEQLYHKGKDSVLRFSVYKVTIFILAENVLGAYVCDYNFIRKVSLNEKTYEYHYRDVVSVTTEEVSQSYTLPDGHRLVGAQAFRLSVSSGESIQVTINSHHFSNMTGGSMPSTGAERAVQVIRTRLREKKIA